MPNSSTEDLIFFVRRSELSHEGYARRSGLETSQLSWAMNRQRNLHQKISLAEISDENLLGQGGRIPNFQLEISPPCKLPTMKSFTCSVLCSSNRCLEPWAPYCAARVPC